VYLSVVHKAEVPLRIVNLKPSTKYLLRVRAINDVGAGTPVIRNELTENIRTYTLTSGTVFSWLLLCLCVTYDVIRMYTPTSGMVFS